MSHDDLSILRSGMPSVVENAREAVAEDRQRLLELHTMLVAIGGSLLRLLLEAHVHWKARNVS